MLLETVKGNLVDIECPESSQIDVEDIAWGLSRISRFAGHTITAIPYNVAQHCVFVSEIVESLISPEENPTLVMHALLHDAAESYIGDIPSPIKHLSIFRPVIKIIEDNLLNAIYVALEVDACTDVQMSLVKTADKIAQRIESHAFMSSRGKNWNLPDVTLEQLQKFDTPKPSLQSYKEFMCKYLKIKEKLISGAIK